MEGLLALTLPNYPERQNQIQQQIRVIAESCAVCQAARQALIFFLSNLLMGRRNVVSFPVRQFISKIQKWE